MGFTLDEISRERHLQGPYLIKIDVQGAELDVLRGGIETLSETEYIILETSLFQFLIGGPEISDVITFMKEKAFVYYEIFGPKYRLVDGAMSQVDMAFVKESGQFRRYHFFATKDQCEGYNKQLIEFLRSGG